MTFSRPSFATVSMCMCVLYCVVCLFGKKRAMKAYGPFWHWLTISDFRLLNRCCIFFPHWLSVPLILLYFYCNRNTFTYTTTGNSIRLGFLKKKKTGAIRKKDHTWELTFRSQMAQRVVASAKMIKRWKKCISHYVWMMLWNDFHLHLSALMLFHGTKFIYSLSAALYFFCVHFFRTANFLRNECDAVLAQTFAINSNGKQCESERKKWQRLSDIIFVEQTIF